MGKRQGSPLHQDMDLDGKGSGPQAPRSGGMRRATPEVLAERRRLRPRRARKSFLNKGAKGDGGGGAKAKPSAPSIKFSASDFSAGGDDGATAGGEDAFAAFGQIGNSGGGGGGDGGGGGGGGDSGGGSGGGGGGGVFSSSASIFAADDAAGSGGVFGGSSGGVAKRSAKKQRKQHVSFDASSSGGGGADSDAGALTLTPGQLKNMRRLNKSFRQQIEQNWEQYRAGDWTIQMLEYVDFAKRIRGQKQQASSAGGAAGADADAATRPRIHRTVTPHPSKTHVGQSQRGGNDDDDDDDDSSHSKKKKTRAASEDDGNAPGSSSGGGSGTDIFGNSSGGSAADIFGASRGGGGDGAADTTDIFGAATSPGAATSDIFGGPAGGGADDATTGNIFATSGSSSGGGDGDGGASIFGSADATASASTADIFGTNAAAAAASFDFGAPAPAPAPASEAEAAAAAAVSEPKRGSKALKTAMDDADVRHTVRAALHKFKDEIGDDGKPTGKKAWTKYGVGDVLIKKADDAKKAQLLMYNDTTGKLFINTYLTPQTTTKLDGKTVLLQVYYEDENEGKGAWLNTTLRVKTPTIAEGLDKAIHQWKGKEE